MMRKSQIIARSSLNVALVKKLECPVCMESMVAPIYMCRNSHSICFACQPKILTCPICKEPGRPEIRNRTLEELAVKAKLPSDAVDKCNCALKAQCCCANSKSGRNLDLEKVLVPGKLPCDNAASGCMEMLSSHERPNHLLKCRYKCMIDECIWCGTRELLELHVITNHSESYRQHDHRSWSSVNPDQSQVLFVALEESGEFFWLNLKYTNEKTGLYLYTVYIGSSASALRFMSVFSIYYLYTDSPTLLHYSSELALALEDDYLNKCSVIPVRSNNLKIMYNIVSI